MPFDPNQPFEVLDAQTPKASFDPNKPFEVISTKGGEQNEVNKQSQPEAQLDNNEQRQANQQVGSSIQEGVQPSEVQLQQSQGQEQPVGSINANLTTGGESIAKEEQTTSRSQGQETGEGLRSQIPAWNQEEVDPAKVQPPAEDAGAGVAGLGSFFEGTVGLLSGLGAAALASPAAVAAGVPTGGLGALGVEVGAFLAGSYAGKIAAKRIEELLGIKGTIEASQQANPITSTVAGIVPMVPQLLESGIAVGAKGLAGGVKSLVEGGTKTEAIVAGAKEAAKPLAVGAVAGTAFEPARYGVEKSLDFLGIKGEIAPLTLEGTMESALFGAAMGGAGLSRANKELEKLNLSETGKALTKIDLVDRAKEIAKDPDLDVETAYRNAQKAIANKDTEGARKYLNVAAKIREQVGGSEELEKNRSVRDDYLSSIVDEIEASKPVPKPIFTESKLTELAAEKLAELKAKPAEELTTEEATELQFLRNIPSAEELFSAYGANRRKSASEREQPISSFAPESEINQRILTAETRLEELNSRTETEQTQKLKKQQQRIIDKNKKLLETEQTQEAELSRREEAKKPTEPAKQNEEQIQETSGVSTEQGKPLIETTAIQTEEGTAQRQGKGQEEVAPTEPTTPAQDIKQGVGGFGGGINDALFKTLWDKVTVGEVTENGKPSAVLTAAKRLRELGGITTIEEFRSFANEFAGISELPKKQRLDALNALAKKYTASTEAQPKGKAYEETYVKPILVTDLLSYREVERGLPSDFSSVDKLKKSISERGFDEPLTFYYDPVSGKGQLIDGNHRIEAAKQLGITEVPIQFQSKYKYFDGPRGENANQIAPKGTEIKNIEELKKYISQQTEEAAIPVEIQNEPKTLTSFSEAKSPEQVDQLLNQKINDAKLIKNVKEKNKAVNNFRKEAIARNKEIKAGESQKATEVKSLDNGKPRATPKKDKILPETPKGTRVLAAAYRRPSDDKIFYGSSHNDAMHESGMTYAEIRSKYGSDKSRESPIFGYKTDASEFVTRGEAEQVARQSKQVDVAGLEADKKLGLEMHSNRISLDEFPAFEAPEFSVGAARPSEFGEKKAFTETLLKGAKAYESLGDAVTFDAWKSAFLKGFKKGGQFTESKLRGIFQESEGLHTYAKSFDRNPADLIDFPDLWSGKSATEIAELSKSKRKRDVKLDNDDIDELRKGLGYDPIMKPEAESFGDVWKEAMERINANETALSRLISGLRTNPTALNPVEKAMLRYATLDALHTLDVKTRSLGSALDKVERKRYSQEYEQAHKDLNELLEIEKRTASASGSSLNAVKLINRSSTNVFSMIDQYKMAKGSFNKDQGRIELTPQELARVREQSRALVEAIKVRDQTIQEVKIQEANKVIGAFLESSKKDRIAGERITSLSVDEQIAQYTMEIETAGGDSMNMGVAMRGLARAISEKLNTTDVAIVSKEVNERIKGIMDKEWNENTTKDALAGNGIFGQHTEKGAMASFETLTKRKSDFERELAQVMKTKNPKERDLKMTKLLERNRVDVKHLEAQIAEQNETMLTRISKLIGELKNNELRPCE